MRFPRFRLLLAVVAATSLLAVSAPPAFAFTPSTGAYQQIKNNRILASFKVTKRRTSTGTRRYVKNFTGGNQTCEPVPASIPAIRIKKDAQGVWRFSLVNKTVKDVLSRNVTVTIKGRFTSATRARGTYRYKLGSCDSGAKSFSVKRVGP
jgi:hypothetical protein